MLTKQSVFNKVAAALIKQNKKCGVIDVDKMFICVYDDGHGNRCAIGHILSDEDIATIMRWKENSSPLKKMLSIFGQDESENFTFIRQNLGFCADLQSVHDNADSHETFKDRLARFAQINNLEFKP